MTPHSIVRSLLFLRWKLLATVKGADDVTMTGAERPETGFAVILGVDTHLDFGVRPLGADHRHVSSAPFAVASSFHPRSSRERTIL